MKVKFLGFQLLGSSGTPTSAILDYIMANPAPGTNFYKRILCGMNRTIVVHNDPRGFYKGLMITASSHKDYITFDEATNTTVLTQIKDKQIKMNYFIFSKINNAGLYAYYPESVSITELSKCLSEPYRALNGASFTAEQTSLKATTPTKKQEIELTRKYFPRGRQSLKLVRLLTEESFNELLSEAKGLIDLQLEVDFSKMVPLVGSRQRFKAAIKTTRLTLQFDKEYLSKSARIAKLVINELGVTDAKARLVSEAMEQVAYSSGTRESFPTMDYEDFKVYFTSILTGINSSPIFDRMWALVENHSLFKEEIIECDVDDEIEFQEDAV